MLILIYKCYISFKFANNGGKTVVVTFSGRHAIDQDHLVRTKITHKKKLCLGTPFKTLQNQNQAVFHRVSGGQTNYQLDPTGN